MSKRFFLVLGLMILFTLKFSAQSFSYRTSQKEMCGDPGEIFACTFSFTNTANSAINIFIDRYQKTMPAYWNSCYCYSVCHSPLRDTLTINIPAFSTDMVVVQFKTDSINPGVATSDFKLYQLGFQNNADSFKLEASSACNLTMGLNDGLGNTNRLKLYPNPINDYLSISLDEMIKEIIIYNVIGELKEKIAIENLKEKTLDLSCFRKGVYIIVISTENNIYQRKFIKEY